MCVHLVHIVDPLGGGMCAHTAEKNKPTFCYAKNIPRPRESVCAHRKNPKKRHSRRCFEVIPVNVVPHENFVIYDYVFVSTCPDIAPSVAGAVPNPVEPAMTALFSDAVYCVDFSAVRSCCEVYVGDAHRDVEKCFSAKGFCAIMPNTCKVFIVYSNVQVPRDVSNPASQIFILVIIKSRSKCSQQSST